MDDGFSYFLSYPSDHDAGLQVVRLNCAGFYDEMRTIVLIEGKAMLNVTQTRLPCLEFSSYALLHHHAHSHSALVHSHQAVTPITDR